MSRQHPPPPEAVRNARSIKPLSLEHRMRARGCSCTVVSGPGWAYVVFRGGVRGAWVWAPRTGKYARALTFHGKPRFTVRRWKATSARAAR